MFEGANMPNIEKELKFKIDDIKKIESKLKKLGAKQIGSEFQRTIRFDTPDLSYEKQGTFIRVRKGFGNTVTMKKKIKTTGELFERIEIETEVSDTEKLRTIFNELGLSKEFIMEKYRSNWTFIDTVVSIDKMPFGNYLEIEGEPDKVKSVAKTLSLDLKNKIVGTYWDLFEDFKKSSGHIGEHIVFDQIKL